MKLFKILGVIVLISFFTMGNVLAQSVKSMSDVKKAVPVSSTYYVAIPHKVEQCMKLMEGMGAKGDAYLSKFKFGCMSGDHTAYGFVKGSSVDEVRKTLPENVQASAKIEKVDAFTAQQIKDLHKGM